MPTISSAGIGSGLDVAGIIDGLMAVERRPLQLLQVKREQFTAQISAYGELISSVSAFQASVDKLSTLSALNIFKGTSSNPDVVSVTATDNPDLGSFGIEVSRLAEKHKMASKEILDTDTFGGRRATDALHIQVGSD
ncbi:MAG: flagellar cap protein, partial [Gammaproteobacteria bacterium]|nr:flagellar cap protein [Gammaproteobacteria bacterium]